MESPLDGTVYELATGRVLSWCPKDTPMRKLLGGIKDNADPVPLPVYPVKMGGADGGKTQVYVNFSTPR